MNDNPLALVVEDNLDADSIFSEALKAAGFEVEIIGAGDKALERLAVTTPALVALDMHLPHVAGPDILRYIHAEPRLAEMQVIIITADASMADTLYDQVALVLLKPISYSQLRDMAKRLRSTMG
jgi:CheY-like chemotaxis protein